MLYVAKRASVVRINQNQKKNIKSMKNLQKTMPIALTMLQMKRDRSIILNNKAVVGIEDSRNNIRIFRSKLESRLSILMGLLRRLLT